MRTYRIDEGSAEWFVRGTDSEAEALQVLLVEEPDAIDHLEAEDYDIEPYADVERTGWFRFNPCTCGEHAWHLGNATGPGRGNFLGVYLSVLGREVDFEIDYKALDEED